MSMVHATGDRYIFTKPWIDQHLKIVDGIYHIDYTGHEQEQEIRRLFEFKDGQPTLIPCPFGESRSRQWVTDQLYVSLNRPV